MKTKQLTLVIFSLVTLAGCQTIPYEGKARNVSLKPKQQGVISIPTEFRDEDRTKAETLMAKNCSPLAPEVVSEGEIAVGTKTNSTDQTTNRKSNEVKMGSLFGIPVVSGDEGGTNSSSSSTVTQLKEWHISYKCQNQKKTSTSM